MVKFNRYYTFVVIFLFSSLLLAQNSEVKFFPDSTRYFIGDYIHLNLEVSHPVDSKIVLPSLKDSLSDAEFIKLETKESTKKDNYNLSTFTFIISKYDSGFVKLKPLKIKILDKNNNTSFLYTDSIQIKVVSFKVDTSKAFADIKKPVLIPIDWVFVLLISIIVLLIIILLYFGYKYYQKKKAIKQGTVQVVRLSNYEIAKNALKELEEKKLWQNGEIKQYHTEITYIIRKYIEDEFNFPALETTSEEIINSLIKLRITDATLQNLKEFFENADMVKFAKFIPMQYINEKMLVQAYQILEDFNTKPFTVINTTNNEANYA